MLENVCFPLSNHQSQNPFRMLYTQANIKRTSIKTPFIPVVDMHDIAQYLTNSTLSMQIEIYFPNVINNAQLCCRNIP